MKKPFSLASDELSESEAEDLRIHLSGWKEDSGSTKVYSKRYKEKKEIYSDLNLQQEKKESNKNDINNSNK